jgi:hypothetical protein
MDLSGKPQKKSRFSLSDLKAVTFFEMLAMAEAMRDARSIGSRANSPNPAASFDLSMSLKAQMKGGEDGTIL